jgi:hypothetical protein
MDGVEPTVSALGYANVAKREETKMLRALHFRCRHGARDEMLEGVSGSWEDNHILGRTLVIWGADPIDPDGIYVVEYWNSLEEFGNAEHAEYSARFESAMNWPIEERTLLFEARPEWIHRGAEFRPPPDDP